jgi:hypothetical protein
MKGIEMSTESVIDIPDYMAGEWTVAPDHVEFKPVRTLESPGTLHLRCEVRYA